MKSKSKNKTHNEIFSELQDEYFKTNRNPEVLGKMYLVIKEMETNYIQKYCKTNGVEFSFDEMEDRIETATLFVIERYLKYPDFRIDKISAYAGFGRCKALHNVKQQRIDAFERYSLENLQEELGDGFYNDFRGDVFTEEELKRLQLND